MKKNANYIILPEYRLIVECCKGHAMVEDAISMKKDELSDALYNPDYDIIVDFQEFETFLDSSIIESVTNFLSFLKDLNMKGRVAFLTGEPHQVVISLIMKELGNDFGGIRIDVFSTVKAALRFLGIQSEYHDLIKNKILVLNSNTA